MKISVIIPTYNEAENLKRLLPYLQKNAGEQVVEIIVSDAGSTDSTLSVASELGAVAVLSPVKGRAGQMNYASQLSKGDVLYFVHADTLPPASFTTDIEQALTEGYVMGGFWFRFDKDTTMLRVNALFSRLNLFFSRGGDQSFFVKKDFFENLGGYRNDYVVMEEYEFFKRARKLAKFKVIPKETLVSARKYEHNSWLRVNFANLVAVLMFRFGYEPLKILKTYKKLIKHPKADAPV